MLLYFFEEYSGAGILLHFVVSDLECSVMNVVPTLDRIDNHSLFLIIILEVDYQAEPFVIEQNRSDTDDVDEYYIGFSNPLCRKVFQFFCR